MSFKLMRKIEKLYVNQIKTSKFIMNIMIRQTLPIEMK